MNSRRFSLFSSAWALALALGALACSSSTTSDAGADGSVLPPDGGDGGTQPACAPASPDYPSADFATNAADELALINQFKAFNQKMRDAEASLSVTPTVEELRALYAGPPSIKDATSSYYQGVVDEALVAFAAAAGKAYTPAEPPPANGGLYDKWIFDPRGVDLRQLIEKGSFASLYYRRAAELAGGTVTPAVVDRILALYGSNPTFSGKDKEVPSPDVLGAVYASRRDAKDAANPGFYLRIKANLVAARAAAEKTECSGEAKAALDAVLTDWEKALGGTVIFYMKDAATKAAAPATAAAALHGLGEAIGFVQGFRQLPADIRIITDAQVDELLALMEAPPSGTKAPYKLVTDAATVIPKLEQVVTRLASIYGFTPEQVASFATNK
jgi:hypothetical protein